MNEFTKTEGSILAGTDCADILRKDYGVANVSMKRLMGWCDVTYHVSSQDDGKQFILKVFIDTPTHTIEQIEAEIAMIQFLGERGLPVPKVISTLDGKLYGEADFVDEKKGSHKKQYRLQTYIEGVMLKLHLTQDLCRQIGDLGGRVDVALEHFRNPYYDTTRNEPHFLIQFNEQWKTSDLIPKLDRDHYKKLALESCRLYDEKIGAKIDQLPLQVIQCDMHGNNLIASDDKTMIVGLVDYSDARQTLRIVELAITLGYILTFSPQPLECADAYLNAYEKHVKLLKIEKDALLAAIVGRIIQAMVIHRYLILTLPGYNASYLDGIYGPSWATVEKLLTPTSKESQFFEKFAEMSP